MPAVYDALTSAGKPHGLVHFGSAALNALRMEKAYKTGAELTNEVTPAEAGMKRFARTDKVYPGSDIVTHEAEKAPSRWKLACLEIETTDADPLGSEAVLDGDQVVGAVSSAGYGHAVDKSLAFAYLRVDRAVDGTKLEVLVLGKRRPAVVRIEALWDPTNARIKA